jgi:hypothetical protein
VTLYDKWLDEAVRRFVREKLVPGGCILTRDLYEMFDDWVPGQGNFGQRKVDRLKLARRLSRQLGGYSRLQALPGRPYAVIGYAGVDERREAPTMKVNVYVTEDVSDAERKQISAVLGVKQATRDQMKEFLWTHGANWRTALAPSEDELASLI